VAIEQAMPAKRAMLTKQAMPAKRDEAVNIFYTSVYNY